MRTTRTQLLGVFLAAAALAVLSHPARAEAVLSIAATQAAKEKTASRHFVSLGEGNVKGSLALAAEKRWGHDYMHARYYSSVLGRFLSTDTANGRVNLSQSWNRYSYVRNSPLTLLDPDGRRDRAFYNQKLQEQLGFDGYRELQDRTAEGMVKAAPVGVALGLAPFAAPYAVSFVYSQKFITTTAFLAGIAGVDSPGPRGMLATQQRHIKSIARTIRDHAKPHDFIHAAAEIAGTRTGGMNHVAEMRISVRSLRKHVQALQNSLNSPEHSMRVRLYVRRIIKKTNSVIERMEQTLQGGAD